MQEYCIYNAEAPFVLNRKQEKWVPWKVTCAISLSRGKTHYTSATHMKEKCPWYNGVLKINKEAPYQEL